MRRRTLAALGVGALVVVGGASWAIGPGAAGLVDHFADGRRVWRLGVLDVSGVRGVSLSDLRIARLTLRDADGVWIEARDARLQWRPFELLRGRVDITRIDAAAIEIARRPALSAPPPDRGGTPDVTIGALSVARIALAPNVAGEAAAALSLSGALSVRDDALATARLDADNLANTGEVVRIRYARAPILSADVQIRSPKAGVIAAFVGGAVDVQAKAQNGKGEAVAKIDDAEALRAQAQWTDASWTGDARANLLAIPPLRRLAARIGGAWTASASGAPFADDRPARVTLSVRSERLAATADGAFTPSLAPVGPVQIKADADAHVLSLSSGRIRTQGALAASSDVSRYRGDLVFDRAHLVGADVSAKGALDLRADRTSLRIEANLGDATVAGGDVTARLLSGGDAALDLRYARQEGVVTISALSIRSRLLTVRGAGVVREGQPLSGSWALADLRAIVPEWRGRGLGAWRFTPAEDPTLDLDGRVEALAGLPEPLDQLMGPRADIDAALTFDRSVAVRSARVLGRNLRAAVRGRVEGDALALDLEATARGPLRIGGARVDGAADIVGKIGGVVDAWSVGATAQLSTLDVGGFVMRRATVRTMLSPEPGGHAGVVSFNALALDRPLSATGDLVLGDEGLLLSNVDATLANLRARGRLDVSDAGPQGAFTLSGLIDGLAPDASGHASGSLRLAPKDWAMDLALRDASFGPQLDVRTGRLTLVGSYEAPQVSASAAGFVGDAAPFRLAASGSADFRDGAQAVLTIDGALAGAAVATRRPLTIAARPRGGRLDGALAIGGGVLDLTYTDDGRALAFDATATDVPLAALAISGEPLDGAASGRLVARGEGATLTGTLDADVRGFRLARRARDPIDAQLRLALRDGRLAGSAQATSAGGLTARAEGALPMDASAAPLRIARRPGATGDVTWTAAGPIDGLWSVFGPLDQSLVGRVDGQGVIRIGDARLAGSGALTLREGRFEDKITGIVLRDMQADIAFDEDGAVLRSLSARDRKNGKLSGSGRLGAGQDGDLRLDIDDMQVLDRPDAKAIGDGRLTLTWTRDGMKLGGDVEILSADLTPPQLSAPPPPLIDVVEINRPGGARRAAPQAKAGAVPVAMDVRIRGPRRIFTRGRGAEAEWALDVRATGSPDAPRLFGEARLLRGQVNLAGRPFALSDGVVTFRGDPLDADVTMTAEATTTDLSATVRISGRIQDPQIDITSTPGLPEDEILPQILFGRSAQDLSPLQAAQLAASLATLAGRGSFDVADAARRAVDLDRLDLREEAGDVLVTGGKYITRDVYLEVSRGALGATSTSVEWQVRPRLFLISSFLANGDQRVAVRWRRSY
ncbi:MAG: translocation/assembly module TamB domain-containing protein [Alphaproteobacteria bacterium]|nr:translocation/assembly module TamB domain-containing protein [Alphaproteobacteria bacterium]